MQDNRSGVRRVFRLGPLMVAIAGLVGIVLVAVTLFSPVSTTKVSASQANDSETVSAEALAIALDLKSGANYSVFGGRGLLARGNVEIRGKAGSAGRISGLSVAANLADGGTARADMRTALGFINQLPCRSVDSADLGGKSFGPGVYCLSSANLAGAMTLDAAGDENAVFVFRVGGDFNASNGSSVSLANGARSTNAYFVSSKATIGDNSTFDASVIADSDITVGAGTDVSGKVISVNGNVSAADAILGVTTGFIEICKDLAPGETRITNGTIFTFTVAGRNILVPAGGCSGPQEVTAGNVTVTEAARADTIVTSITATLGNGQAAPNRLVTANLATRTAVAAIPAGPITDETIVRFANATSRTGFIEICKNGLDGDVTGPWTYVIPGNLAAGAPATVTVFTNSCSAPIAVTLPSQVATGSFFNVTVTELGRPTFIFDPTLTTTLPTGRVVSSVLNNDNGGTVQIQVIAGGDTTNQTTVFFNNRSLPGRIKVCKITADPNIPVGTRFQFNVTGQRTVGGPVLTETVEAQAGPDAQGGFCTLSAFSYVVGSTVRVDEATVTATDLPVGITPDMVRVSRIRSSAAFIVDFIANPPAGVTPNPYASMRTIQRNTLTSVDFTNFIYRPAILKVCKTTTGAIAAGTPFNFSIVASSPLQNISGSTAVNVTVPAGGCVFAPGPFPGAPGFDGVGTFNLNTSYVVTEGAATGTVITAISSPTACTPTNLTPDIANRRATFLLCRGTANGLFNEITFNNAPTPAAAPSAATRFDFDGDHISDPVIFRPSTGMWWYASSSRNGQHNGATWGMAGDELVPADYDGDGTTDWAVFRPSNGSWYIMGSKAGFMAMQWGYGTDIPEPADYDGDGKTDIAVFRPTNGGWYIMGSSAGYSAFQFGFGTDKPVPADYDGDGKADAAVYRDGNWYVLGSQSGFYGFPFGLATDKPVPADYDGDGKADAAVFRNGTWYLNRSQAGFAGLVWGLGTDVPVPADYDGDGKTDPAVFRPSTANWYITQSGSNATSGGYTSVWFGAPGDELMNY